MRTLRIDGCDSLPVMSTSGRRPRPIEVRALSPYRIWLRYDDGVEGEVDLSHKAGKGVFAAWEDHSFFAAVRIGPGDGILWGDDIDLCPDAQYLKLSGTPVCDNTAALGGREAVNA